MAVAGGSGEDAEGVVCCRVFLVVSVFHDVLGRLGGRLSRGRTAGATAQKHDRHHAKGKYAKESL